MEAGRAIVRVWLFLALGVGAASCPEPTTKKLERPAPPSEGVADARVVFVSGDVAVTPAQGTAFSAKVGLDLVADDRVAPATAAKIVVVLRNGHAIRLDDTGALAVKDILLFNAPATDRDAAEQLAALLDPDEVVPLADVRDRAAAWRQMLRAGESGGAESARSRQRSESASAKANEASAVVASAEVPSKPPGANVELDQGPAGEKLAQKKAPPPARGSGKDLGGMDVGGKDVEGAKSSKLVDGHGGAGGAGGAGVEGTLDEGDKQAVPPPPQAPVAPAFAARFGATPKDAAPIDLPAALASVAGALGGCVATATVGIDVPSVDVLLEVRGGTVVRMRLGGALPVPACARSLVPRTLEVGDGWLVVTVPLRR